ncbi:GntR family transcriptional regulator [Aquincola sp. MAHUQ-54]|uniref:GntR family transcriptional regulator n=1 Tax=Aquincola agrisoli TaxID=3119538 RepID=A0AAW9QME0_9BURK
MNHSELARELVEGITAGRFAVGTLLPTEFELCDRYGASRYTVRKALDELQELGLISRKRNVGTRVEAPRPARRFTQSIATVDELAQFGAAHVRLVRSVEDVVADAGLAAQLGCDAGSAWLRISSLRMDGGRRSRPIAWTDVYVDAAYTEIGALVRESPETLISSLIERRYGRRIVQIRQEISATSVPKALAEELQVEPGTPALKVLRRYLDSAGKVFEISLTLHPENRFVLSTSLERAGGPRPDAEAPG